MAMVTAGNNRLALATEGQLIEASRAIYDELSGKFTKQFAGLGEEFAGRIAEVVASEVQKQLPIVVDACVAKLVAILQGMPSVNVMIPPRNVEKTIEYDGMNRPYKINEKEI